MHELTYGTTSTYKTDEVTFQGNRVCSSPTTYVELYLSLFPMWEIQFQQRENLITLMRGCVCRYKYQRVPETRLKLIKCGQNNGIKEIEKAWFSILIPSYCFVC